MFRIAIVDDDITTRSLIKMLLEMEGYEADNLSTDIDDIIVSLKKNKFHALFIDVHLHSQSGLEIVKKLRSLKKFANLRILMISGMDVGEKCMAVGADGFLLKPFMPNELVDWLKTNLPKE